MRTLVLALCITLAACSPTPKTSPAPTRAATPTPTPDDPPSKPQSLVPPARAHVEAFFGAPYPGDFEVQIVPSRNAFADLTEQRWGFRAEPCWMVAAGTGSIFAMIDPEVWPTDACEHDRSDAEHIRRLVTHELVHVYHGQHNADPEFNTMGELAWFVEGLAVYASGQFDAERRAQAEQAAGDAWPTALDTAWSGSARYATCGAIAAWIDATYGRALITDLLAAGSTQEALDHLEIDEAALLARVRSWLQHEAMPPT